MLLVESVLFRCGNIVYVFYVFLIDVMSFFVYYRERDTFGICNGDLGYSKYNHMPSYWDLWKGNCIFDFFFFVKSLYVFYMFSCYEVGLFFLR